MWDMAADGYSHGEGVACVVLKDPKSQALSDNDPIECVIRETAVDQDGRTPGLTMPSNAAQTALIRACYACTGLDIINRPQDRPQFSHAVRNLSSLPGRNSVEDVVADFQMFVSAWHRHTGKRPARG